MDGHAAKQAALSRKLTGLGPLVASHATKPAEVERLLKEFTRICRRRLDGAPVRHKVVLIADEVSMMYEDAAWEPLRTGRTLYVVPAPVAALVAPPLPPVVPDVAEPAARDAPGHGEPAPPATAGTAVTTPLTDDERAILDCWRQGKGVHQVLRELWPDLRGKGPTMNAYQDRLALINRTVFQYGASRGRRRSD